MTKNKFKYLVLFFVIFFGLNEKCFSIGLLIKPTCKMARSLLSMQGLNPEVLRPEFVTKIKNPSKIKEFGMEVTRLKNLASSNPHLMILQRMTNDSFGNIDEILNLNKLAGKTGLIDSLSLDFPILKNPENIVKAGNSKTPFVLQEWMRFDEPFYSANKYQSFLYVSKVQLLKFELSFTWPFKVGVGTTNDLITFMLEKVGNYLGDPNYVVEIEYYDGEYPSKTVGVLYSNLAVEDTAYRGLVRSIKLYKVLESVEFVIP